MSTQLYISNVDQTKVFLPAVQEGVEWSTKRKGEPGKLSFSVYQDDVLDFSEGSAVRLEVDGDKVFYGWVFKRQMAKDHMVKVTAYDQLRYLKNKDTYVYTGKKASEFLQMVAEDFSLKVGELEDTGYVIPSRVEDNASLFDMVLNALDQTLTNTGNLFVLYDDFGKITLKSLENMKVRSGDNYLLLDESTGENYEYSSSIDSNTYNKIKLTYENDSTGKRDTYISQDGSHINEWGILQYYDTIKEGENGQVKADALLNLYNAKTRTLKLTNQIGDNRVRAGSLVVVNLDLGDVQLKNFMLVEECTHKYKLDQHLMDLTLRGGGFNG